MSMTLGMPIFNKKFIGHGLSGMFQTLDTNSQSDKKILELRGFAPIHPTNLQIRLLISRKCEKYWCSLKLFDGFPGNF